MNMPNRLRNLTGAWALAVTEASAAAVTDVAGAGGELAAAVITIGAYRGQSLDELRRALGLSQPGTVKLVDRLVERGWVLRQPGRSGRSLSLALTPDGAGLLDDLLAARAAAIEGLLAPLTAHERDELEGTLDKLLGAAASAERLRHLCRLCERRVCTDCPVARGARDDTGRHG
jgi:DNA-binding MarR family transcriptional regulator